MLPASQESQLDDAGRGHDLGADFARQCDRRRQGPAGRQQVVENNHALAFIDGVGLDRMCELQLCLKGGPLTYHMRQMTIGDRRHQHVGPHQQLIQADLRRQQPPFSLHLEGT